MENVIMSNKSAMLTDIKKELDMCIDIIGEADRVLSAKGTYLENENAGTGVMVGLSELREDKAGSRKPEESRGYFRVPRVIE